MGSKISIGAPDHAMKYVIEDRLLEALRMRWQDTKMSKLEGTTNEVARC